ncbi:unnamed protein product [Bursaphelenchus okinawaensis]|uniref:ShKT domain-containing protein n=1 Tax=Bursaphelenchus okinawaensis TaxID=465554 RepID=A0A811KEZ6_9BILA|nr:unnamed protein product [Bursaphelenchus okinawaensis]CAG9103383.1 unnamed protein product [Bursaphelenchus okinawaensis]
MLRYLLLTTLLYTVKCQTCPDGIPAAFECVKKGGEYKCVGDSSLGCEQINGIRYCCATDPDKKEKKEPSTKTVIKTDKTSKNETDSEETETTTDCYDKGPDCSRLNYLCDNSNYKEIMTDQCPVTCGLCSDSSEEEKKTDSKESDCEDRGNDCRKLRYLCDNSIYRDFMKNECPKTCNRC